MGIAVADGNEDLRAKFRMKNVESAENAGFYFTRRTFTAALCSSASKQKK